MRPNSSQSWCVSHRQDWSAVSQPTPERERNRWRQSAQPETKFRSMPTGPAVRSRKLARLEAVLFVAEGALTSRKLAQFATLADAKEAQQLVEQLNESYARSGTSFRVECVAGGYRLLTQPQFAIWLDKLHDREAEVQLSPPAMETLTIVAYRQPVTRADIEAVRGVQSSEILKLLMEKGLVRITGEEDSLGRPYLYGTTNMFLEAFGLGSLKDLPMREDFAPDEEVPEDPQQEFEFEEAAEVVETDSEEVESEEPAQEGKYEIATLELGETEEEGEPEAEYAEEESEVETLEAEETWEETDDEEESWDNEEYEDDEEAA